MRRGEPELAAATNTGAPVPDPVDAVAVPPRRLSARSLIVDPFRRLGAFLLPVTVAFLLSGHFTVDRAAFYGLGAGLLSVVYSAVRWLTFRYTVRYGRLDITSGLLHRRSRSIPLDRIRGVDVAASPLHRLLRVVVVRVDAAAGGSGQVDEGVLDAVSVAEGTRLRRLLLARRPAGGAEATAGGAATTGDVLAKVKASWFLYSPLTGAYLFAPLAVLGTVWGWAGQEPFSERRVIGWAEWLAGDPWLLGLTAGCLLLLGLPVASIAVTTVLNWGFTVRSTPDALNLQRGLLTRRHVTLERRRVRGWELVEALPARPTHSGRLLALVTGLSGRSRAELLPVGPVAAIRLLAGQTVGSVPGPLRRHPRAARRRRLFRAVVPWLLVTGLTGWGGQFGAAAVAAVLAVVGVPLALDRYRSLGHAYADGFLCVRSGSWSRRTVLVQQQAVVGWQVRQTFFQRRQGLATLVVGVGAGSGGYRAVDMDARAAGELARQVTPRWVEPFLAAEERS
ncbi:MAG: PH domain-containing protein [Streptosporangiales bacterium]|nr:PH domain-containing protein [Streptosporangiales bacterium]